MSYAVKEIYFTLQGEGAHSGRPAVFMRMSGCNLWNGREEDRKTAICTFCDTDFVGTDGIGGARFADAEALAKAARKCWDNKTTSARPYVVCTGGEPLLQLDDALIGALHKQGFEIGVETNGTLKAPGGIDWICVSPKGGAKLEQISGDELKLVYPQAGLTPQDFESLDFAHFFLQPMDGPVRAHNTRAALSYCLEHPRWKLSVQAHKLVNMA